MQIGKVEKESSRCPSLYNSGRIYFMFQDVNIYILPVAFYFLHQPRNQHRHIQNQEEHNNQPQKIRDDGLGDPFDRETGDAGGDEQVDGDRRRDHTDGDADDEDDAEVDQADAHGLYERQKDRRQNDDRG